MWMIIFKMETQSSLLAFSIAKVALFHDIILLYFQLQYSITNLLYNGESFKLDFSTPLSTDLPKVLIFLELRDECLNIYSGGITSNRHPKDAFQWGDQLLGEAI